MDTNRPDYAPDRRLLYAGLERAAWDLIALHTTQQDAQVIAGLLEAGASAIEHTPLRGSDAVGINGLRRFAEVGRAAAQALRDEVERCRARDEHRYGEQAKAQRKADREQAKAQRKADREQRREQESNIGGGISTPDVAPAAEVDTEAPPANVWTVQHHVGPQALDHRQDVENALEVRMRSQLEERGATPTSDATFTWTPRDDGTYDLDGSITFADLELQLDPDAQVAAAAAIERPRRR